MGRAGEAWRRLRLFVTRGRQAAEMDEEIRFHLDMRAAEQRARGLDATDASWAARRRFGSTVLVREEAREAWGWPALDAVSRDVRLALRSLRRSPGFVSVALISLALGIGVNVSIFAFVNALFLSPLPAVAGSDSLLAVRYRTRGGQGYFTSSSYPGFEYVRAQNRTFVDVLAYMTETMALRTGSQPEAVTGELVSPNYFEVLGVKPAMGRTFAQSEGRVAGADPVVVLAYQFWRERLAADPGIVGRRLQVGADLFTVIGVAPRGFQGLSLEWEQPPAVWVLTSMYRQVLPAFRDPDLLHNAGNESFAVVGRLRPGTSTASARADLARLTPFLRPDRKKGDDTAFPDDEKLVPALDGAIHSRFWIGYREDIVSFLEILGATAAIVFLIACVNVTGLVLARAMKRQKELALQLSLGASRGRLITQLLTENLLLSVAAGAAALLVARWSAAALSWFGQAFRTDITIDTGVDARVLLFTAAVAIACSLMLTILPARLASRTSLVAIIGGSHRAAGRGRHRVAAREVLVGLQVALSVVLLLGASLFIRTLHNARAVDPTVRPHEVVVAHVNLADARYEESRGSAFYVQVLDRLRSLPGVRDAAFVSVVPLGGRRGGTNILPSDGRSQKPMQVGLNVVTTGYFSTVGLPIVRGRGISDADRAGAGLVAVINEVMAQRLFSGRDPIGERLFPARKTAAPIEIIGVVTDGPFRDYRSKIEPTMYVPLPQWYQPEMNLEVRVAGDGTLMLPAIRREVASIDKAVVLIHEQTMQAHLDAALARERLTASLLVGFGILAVLLAAIGLYGVLSYSVAQRTRELGIRVALGARPSSIIESVLARVVPVGAAGLLTGLVTAIILARHPRVHALLYRVEPSDPLSLVATIAALTLTAGVAIWVPARRAARADPLDALRCD